MKECSRLSAAILICLLTAHHLFLCISGLSCKCKILVCIVHVRSWFVCAYVAVIGGEGKGMYLRRNVQVQAAETECRCMPLCVCVCAHVCTCSCTHPPIQRVMHLYLIKSCSCIHCLDPLWGDPWPSPFCRLAQLLVNHLLKPLSRALKVSCQWLLETDKEEK